MVDGQQVVGKGAGKTTLALRLLHDGHQVEGDELVFTRHGEAMCLPRNFHVKPGSLPLVPELAAGWARLPRTSTCDGVAIRAFNPAAAGFDWRVRLGPVDAAFVLRANHGGAAARRPLSSVALVEAAVRSCVGAGTDRRRVVQACAALLGQVDGYELAVGPLVETADLLVAASSGPAPPICYDPPDPMEVGG